MGMGSITTLVTVLFASEPSGDASPPDTSEAHQEPAEPIEELSVQELDELAREAYAARNYTEAIEYFERAHQVSRDPSYLFNIGRTYEENGDLEQAVAYYERFLDAPEVPLESRRAALERLEVLQDILEARRRRDREADQEDVAPEPTKPPEPKETDDEPLMATPATTTPQADPRADLRRKRLLIAGSVLTSVGAAALVAGGVMGGLALRQEGILDDEAVALEDQRRRVDAANTYALSADGLFIGGGVVMATGVALLVSSLVGRAKARDLAGAPRLQWAPFVGREQVMLHMQTRF